MTSQHCELPSLLKSKGSMFYELFDYFQLINPLVFRAPRYFIEVWCNILDLVIIMYLTDLNSQLRAYFQLGQRLIVSISSVSIITNLLGICHSDLKL